jgi:AcrR family transcriptional regulator
MARARTEGREKAILEAARGLLRKGGAEALTVEGVARAAGISKATFYAYFRGKEALRQALLSGGVAAENLAARDNREAILEAALTVFAEGGFHATSLDDIARSAGVTKGTLYWYFKRKEDLYAALGRRLSPLIGGIPNLARLIDSPPEKMFPLIAGAFLASFENPRTVQIFRLVLTEAPRDPETARQFGGVVGPVVQFLTDYVRRQVEMGRLRPVNPETAARLIIGPLMVYMMGRSLHMPMHDSLPPPVEYARDIVDYLLRGLASAPAAAKEA